MPTTDPEKRRQINKRYRDSANGKAKQRKLVERNRSKIQVQKRTAKQARYWRNREHYRKRDYEGWLRRKEAEAGRRKPDCCDVCGKYAPRIVFDHCHQRGLFRGWLCDDCNIILGHAHDDPDVLRKLIAYLERTAKLVPPQLTLPGL